MPITSWTQSTRGKEPELLSTEQCKKYLKDCSYTDKEIEEIRNSLYQAAEILTEMYIKDKDNGNRKAS